MIANMWKLKPGKIITYIDLNGKHRKITFIKNGHFINAIKGMEPCHQQVFLDERDQIMHIPINAWKFVGITPYENF